MTSKFRAADSLDWSPFQIGNSVKPRPLSTDEGIIDRIRIAAFAERQAYYAFTEAIKIWSSDVPAELVKAWEKIALEEQKHETWLLNRLVELKADVANVPVGLGLYHSFTRCTSAQEFSLYISDSEEKGRLAGLKFVLALNDRDPVTAKIFSDIALEEIDHVALSKKYFN